MKHGWEGVALSQQLRAYARQSRTELSRSEATLLVRHLELVLEANVRLNLTRIVDPDSALRLHIVDSLSVLPELLSSPEGAYADIGSGAGYPGIPLAVLSGRRTTLVESTKKKAEFLVATTGELGISEHVEVFAGRAEGLARERAGGFAVVTARAVSSLASLVELASPLLTSGGSFVALKGMPDEEEIERGDAAGRFTGMRRETVRRLLLPEEQESRSIIVYVKSSDTDVPLPRGDGKAQKRPLG